MELLVKVHCEDPKVNRLTLSIRKTLQDNIEVNSPRPCLPNTNGCTRTRGGSYFYRFEK